jgi:2-oxoisovalerate dehydrogenase E2 component (dihydrolipoyl transacylase)
VSGLATPAVRGLLKELSLNIHEIQGTGKDGRVLKEDVHNHAAAQRASTSSSPPQQTTPSSSSSTSPSRPPPPRTPAATQQETAQPLTPNQNAMFRAMTKSLAIPHFLCADEVDFTSLSALRRKLNSSSSSGTKLSALPFIIKAVSIALESYPLLNSRLDTSNTTTPTLITRPTHNIGVAMDTPAGLIVPNIKDVGSLSILEIAAELTRLATAAQSARLSPHDLSGGTISVSNIGSIAGSYATPLLVEGELAILAIGRVRAVPAFDDKGALVKRDMAALSWSADHRIVDGATLARMGREVQELLQEPAGMMVALR